MEKQGKKKTKQPQNKMFSIVITGGMTIKQHQEIKSHQSEWISSKVYRLQKQERARTSLNPTTQLVGMDIATTPREDSLSMPEDKLLKRAKPSIWHPCLGLYPWETIVQKDTCTPTFTVVFLTEAKTQNHKMSSDRIKLIADVVHKCIRISQTHTSSTKIMKLCTASMDLGGSYTNCIQPGRKRIAYDVPPRQIKDIYKLIYNTKETLKI